VSGFLLHVQQLRQSVLNLRFQVSNISLQWGKPVISEVILVLNCFEVSCRVHKQDNPQLFLELLLKFVDQKVLELQGLLNDLCVFPPNIFQVSRVGLDVNLVDQEWKDVDNAGSSADLEHSIIMLVDQGVQL